MLVDLSAAQDVEAGDGTTSVVVLAGSLLGAAEKLLAKGARASPHCLVLFSDVERTGIHPTTISESFTRAANKAVEFLQEISTPVDLSDRDSLLRAASTSLNSKVRLWTWLFGRYGCDVDVQIVSQYSSVLSPIAVDAVKRLVVPGVDNVDLRDVRIVKKVGGTIEDTELVDGVALQQNVITSASGPTRVEKAKIGLIQFQLSAPKPDVRPRPMHVVCGLV